MPIGRRLLGPLKKHQEVYTLAFSPDGTRIASGSSDSRIYLWDSNTGESMPGLFDGHTKSITGLLFSLDGARLIQRIACTVTDAACLGWLVLDAACIVQTVVRLVLDSNAARVVHDIARRLVQDVGHLHLRGARQVLRTAPPALVLGTARLV